MTQVYSNPERAADPHALPNIEVFYVGPGGHDDTGWYWWPCFPGCLPDDEASGPFATEEEAINDAQSVEG